MSARHRWHTSIALALPLTILPVTLPALAQSAQPRGWTGDVQFLLAAIDSIHPDPYGKVSRDEWKAAAAALEEALPGMRYHEAVAGFARLVALAGDGHTRLGHVRLADHTRVELGLLPGEGFELIYPVAFEVFDDGLYALSTTEAYKAIFGKRVTAINGRPVPDVIEALRPFIAADNEMWILYMVPHYLSQPAYVHAAGITTQLGDPLQLTLTDADGTSLKLDIQSMAAEADATWVEADRYVGATTLLLPLYRQFDDNYELIYLDHSRTVYVRFRQVSDEDEEPLNKFAQRLFQFVDSADVDRLVIDVRRNGGGNNYLIQPLVHGLIRADKINAPGKLFLIIDRGTFSAAISFVGEVERNTHALFVGEPTGSPVNQYGDSERVTLPASGLTVRIATLYWQPSDPRDERPWVVPDIPAPISFHDYMMHRDPALDVIHAYVYEPGTLPEQPNRNWRRPSQQEGWKAQIRW